VNLFHCPGLKVVVRSHFEGTAVLGTQPELFNYRCYRSNPTTIRWSPCQLPHFSPLSAQVRSMSDGSKVKASQFPEKVEGQPQQLIQSDEKADTSAASAAAPQEAATLSTGSKLKIAIRDYGGTVLVFHITMSLMSLGTCYLLVSSGLDLMVIDLLEKVGVSESILRSKITAGGSTFVLAYAIHKVFAPVRLGITLTAVPFIVKKLRAMGILKRPV